MDVDGLYIVSMRPISNLRAMSELFRQGIIEYIQHTRGYPSAAIRWLPCGWHIGKYRSSTKQLTYSYSLGDGGREHEIKAKLQQLVAKALKKKTAFLKATQAPVVLALIDDFHFASLEQWRQAVTCAPASGALAILRVYGEYECDLLAGADPRDTLLSVGRAAGLTGFGS